MGLKYNIGFVFVLLIMGLAMAAMNDTKLVICEDLNLTDPNCTTWWDTLNLTEANFTNITYTNITIVYNDYTNKTINNTTINTNHSTIENNTYITYNYTGNVSDLNFSYADDKIKDFISVSKIDKKISNALRDYVLKTELNSTSVDELKDNLVYWKWAGVIIIILIIFVIGFLFMRIGGV